MSDLNLLSEAIRDGSALWAVASVRNRGFLRRRSSADASPKLDLVTTNSIFLFRAGVLIDSESIPQMCYYKETFYDYWEQ